MDLGMKLGILAGLIHAGAYAWYIINMLRKGTLPNPASWLLWGFLTFLNAASYMVMSADLAKSMLPLVNTTLCIVVVCILTTKRESERVDIYDRLAVGVGVLAGLAWLGWQSATYANLILQVAIAIGFIPMYRGLWRQPSKEKPGPWLIWVIGYSVNAATVVARWNSKWEELAYPTCAFVLHLTVAWLACREVKVPSPSLQVKIQRIS